MKSSVHVIQKNKIKKFQSSIIEWYKLRSRRLPWRLTNDPFKILVAEFLLQKTDVEKVKPVYEEFLRHWPSSEKLSQARLSSLSKCLHPLGLKYKAERLKSTAKILLKKSRGQVPQSEDKLLELPGVGRYIASAVQCFAFNKHKAVLDTNVIRILERIFGIQSKKNRPRDDLILWNFAQKLVPKKNAKDYNWGLLDYGALVCKSKKPLCWECGLKNICIFYDRMNFNTQNT
jgi:A/G-specific adenine glycosylase